MTNNKQIILAACILLFGFIGYTEFKQMQAEWVIIEIAEKLTYSQMSELDRLIYDINKRQGN